MVYRVGIIGCGRPRNAEGATGFGMSHAHAWGYKQSPDARIVALADIDLNNARAFQAEHGGDAVYADYLEMLARESLDIVSIATWPHLHEPMVIAAAQAGVKAIHCEKPMAPTYGAAKRMVEACQRTGTQLSFNHQRRFATAFRTARDLVQEGVIGDLERIEGVCDNLFDWGTHWFDMIHFFNGETPAEWVIGQIDGRGSKQLFGAWMEGQGLSHIRFQNGVHALMMTGYGAQGAWMRLIGTEGMLEVGYHRPAKLRVRGVGDATWRVIDTPAESDLNDCVPRAILDVIDALKQGREPELSGRRALQATELIFATYESSRRRGRIDLPLAVEDSPLLAMYESGEVAR
jgi:UDP-N-acetylglucosamine 3-dehydrogenase